MQHSFANCGQRSSKHDHALILCLIPYFAPSRMISALFSPFRVASYGLQMTFRIRANPDLRPRWGNRQGSNTSQSVLIPQRFSSRIKIAKSLSETLTLNTGEGIRDIAQASCLRRLQWVGNNLQGTCFDWQNRAPKHYLSILDAQLTALVMEGRISFGQFR